MILGGHLNALPVEVTLVCCELPELQELPEEFQEVELLPVLPARLVII